MRVMETSLLLLNSYLLIFYSCFRVICPNRNINLVSLGAEFCFILIEDPDDL
jgi:hypothetical protein